MKQLTKREYLGTTCLHIFVNNKTGEEKVVECSQAEYDALALPNPTNPTLAGHTWKQSYGGSIKVDTPNTMLGENDYCDWKGGYFVIAKDTNGKLVGAEVSKSKVVADKIDVNNL